MPRIPVPETAERVLDAGLDRALAWQRPVVLGYVQRLRARLPDPTPAVLTRQLERHYLAAVTGLGAASGGAAAMPGVGTAASLATGAAEITGFVSATGLYVLALAEVHAVPVSDPQIRRALVLGVLVGTSGARTLARTGVLADGRSGWAQLINRSDTRDRVAGLNSRLTRLLVTRFGARQGALLVGRALPLGIGAGIGAAGNAALARSAIAAARRAFGPLPRTLPPRVVDGG